MVKRVRFCKKKPIIITVPKTDPCRQRFWEFHAIDRYRWEERVREIEIILNRVLLPRPSI